MVEYAADSDCGHALGKYLSVLGARLAVVSTPERGPAVAGNPRCDDIPVMSALERVVGVSDRVVGCYDFAGSASTKECGRKAPDCDMSGDDWKEPSAVKKTQWFQCESPPHGARRRCPAKLARVPAGAGGVVLVDCGLIGP